MSNEERKRKVPRRTTGPDWKDYVAITIALLQTILLPFMLLLLIMLAFVFISSWLFHF